MKSIPVIYSAAMTAKVSSYSPSAGKPAEVMAEWTTLGLPLVVQPPLVATEADICSTHDPYHVKRVLKGYDANGFGTRQLEVAKACRYTVGGMMYAALLATLTPEKHPVVCVPVSGFHHAGWDFVGGFCTFNGLTVAAVSSGKKVLILDCDQHYGDGTAHIIRTLRLHRVKQVSFGQWYGNPSDADHYLQHLKTVLRDVLPEFDLVLYQAGADVHVDDPLGGVLTTAQMLERDTMVFDTCKALGKPVVWNLAGGYQTPLQKVIDLHTQTMNQCIKTYVCER